MAQEQHGISWKDEKLVEHQKTMYNTIITNIVEPSKEQKIFARETNQRLGLVIIEPREHEWLKGVIYNVSHLYGGKDVVLNIIHGNKNKEFVENIINDEWSNVNLYELPIDNLQQDQYNALLTNSQFWSYFKTQFVLIFQSDSFVRKEIPELFFLYDYCGSLVPWKAGNSKRMIQNGGTSLRKVKTMIDICTNNKYDKEKDTNEDVFFATHIDIDCMPPPTLATIFGVEHVYNPDPVVLHQVWRFQTIKDIVKWTNGTAGVPLLNLS
jgi:hypothetical protein